MVLDYGMGNHFSIVKRLLKFDCRVFAGNSVKEMSEADKIVLPGVGHFGIHHQLPHSFPFGHYFGWVFECKIQQIRTASTV